MGAHQGYVHPSHFPSSNRRKYRIQILGSCEKSADYIVQFKRILFRELNKDLLVKYAMYNPWINLYLGFHPNEEILE